MAPQASPTAKKYSWGAAGRGISGRIQKHSGKDQPVIATDPMKTVIKSNQASSQLHPANRRSRPSCTSSLAHAAARRSI
jgi:hypothetical protein